MSIPSDERRLREFFEEACELPPAKQEELISRLRRDEPDLADRLKDLIDADADAEGFFEDWSTSASPGAQNFTVPVVSPGDVVGGFRVEGVIASGGMATVYRARQTQPARIVALKVMRAGFASKELRARFDLESEILGALHHSGIAQIHDAGVHLATNGELPWFAMEFVDGEPLHEGARSRKLAKKDRLELFCRICDAVQHAHQKGVIHRDLKPHNILLDREGNPKVLDFGVARTAESSDLTFATNTGVIIGTVAYMSPEQTRGERSEIDTRTDVYSLGVVLYQLLVEQLPYGDATDAPLHEALRVIREDEPIPISTLDSGLRGDVENIVSKALEKEPSRRYATAAGFAQDIRRHLAYEPVEARSTGAAYRLRKFVRKHRVIVGGAAAILVILVAGIVGTTVGLLRSRAAETEATRLAESERHHRLLAEERAHHIERESQTSARINRFYHDVFTAGPGVRTGVYMDVVSDLIEDAKAGIAVEFADEPRIEAKIRCVIGKSFVVIGDFDRGAAEFRRAIRLVQNLDGDETEIVLLARLGLASIAMQKRDLDGAERLLTATRGQYERAAMTESGEYLSCLRLLARIHVIRGDVEEAALILDPIEHRLESRDLDWEHVQETLLSIASLRAQQGRHLEAIEKIDRVLAILQKHVDSTNMRIPNALIVKSNILKAAGRTEAATQAVTEALAMAERRHGESGMSGQLRVVLAMLLYDAKQFEKAGKELERGFKIIREQPESDREFMMNSLARALPVQARIFIHQRQAVAARAALEECLDRLPKCEEARPIDEAMCHALLASTMLLMREQLTDADLVQLDVHIAFAMKTIRDERMRADVSRFKTDYSILASMLRSEGRLEEAIAILRTLVELTKDLKPEGNVTLLRLRVNLGGALLEAGEAEEAIPHLELLDDLLAMLASTATSLQSRWFYEIERTQELATALMQVDRFEEAEKRLLSLYEKLRKEPAGSNIRALIRLIRNLYDEWDQPARRDKFLDRLRSIDD